jgi:hypothetical protein
LAAPLDEPDVSKKPYEYLTEVEHNEDCEYLELVFKLPPSDFFFRLVTYLEPHLNVALLWRTGAVLHFYGRQSTFAVIEFSANTLRLKVKGKQQTAFRQLLLTYIADNILSYQSQGHTLITHMSERMKVEMGKDAIGRDLVEYHLVQTQLLETLIEDDNHLLNKLKNAILKRGMTVTNNTFINNGNIGGVAQGNAKLNMQTVQVGDNNSIEYVQLTVSELLQALNQETQAAPSDLAEVKAVLEEVQQSKVPDESLLTRAAGVLKNADTIKNASQSLITQFSEAATVIGSYLA